MKKKRYIALCLLFISIIMLMVPVIPHHHHIDGLICMKNDITADCCGHHHSSDNDHCCCGTGCVTTYFVQQTPTSDSASTYPDCLWVTTLFFKSLSGSLSLPEADTQRHGCVYLESLHGTFITRATGLRAPPSVLA